MGGSARVLSYESKRRLRCTLKLYLPVPGILPLEHCLELETEAFGIPEHRERTGTRVSSVSLASHAQQVAYLMTELVVSFLSVVRAWRSEEHTSELQSQ